ncbi:MAG TPA: hypothetical protein VGV06_09130 [Methylomirabilota bacterium]|nr:hypothetical protein [Methylomirabilota bacterium]
MASARSAATRPAGCRASCSARRGSSILAAARTSGMAPRRWSTRGGRVHRLEAWIGVDRSPERLFGAGVRARGESVSNSCTWS